MKYREESGDGWTLRLGDYREVLADAECDAVITDPPYSERVHSKQKHGRKVPERSPDRCLTHNGIGYSCFGPEDVAQMAAFAGRARSWAAVFSSHDMCKAYADAFVTAGRYVFAPLACVQSGRSVRLAGDGPANWTDYLTVARPRQGWKWRALPGAYIFGQDQARKRGVGIHGGKPLPMMRAIVRDYSRPGDLICDPCAGGGTTLLAAVTEGRRAIGAEIDPETFELAVKRLRRGYTPDLFTGIA